MKLDEAKAELEKATTSFQEIERRMMSAGLCDSWVAFYAARGRMLAARDALTRLATGTQNDG